MNNPLIVLTTVSDVETGQILAEKIVEARLAACVTVSAGQQSLYWWEGKITQEQEFTLFIKTTKELFAKLEQKILDIHPYQVPEIMALPVTAGNKDYLDWIEKETQA